MYDYYLLFDSQGVLVTRLLPGGNIPENATLVDYDLWARTMAETDGVWKLNADGSITKHDFPPPPPPTPEEIRIANESVQADLLAQASQIMAPILVSLQLGDATDEETVSARAWQEYYRALKLVDVSSIAPEWPVTPTS